MIYVVAILLGITIGAVASLPLIATLRAARLLLAGRLIGGAK